MISEVTFSRSYSSFWIDLFPWLNSYSQSVNKYHLKNIHEKTFYPVHYSELAMHRSINNTISFFHFKNLKNKIDDLDKSKAEAFSFLERLPGNNISTYSFDMKSEKIILEQTMYLSETYPQKLHFNPFFRGCGIIDNCHGDIFIESGTLVEVKAGERNIYASDIKQLIVYLSLNWLSDKDNYNISKVEIYNPRMGYQWTNEVDQLINSITDIPKEDAFDQLTKFLIVQSEEIEI